MRRCQFCNAELPELARFCSNCGYMVPPAIDVQSGLDPFLWTHRVWTVISIVAHKQLDGESFGIVLVVEETSSR